jgi:osmotically inducible protein OsmC
MIFRTSLSKWQGSGKEGSGLITTPSGALQDYPYSYESRFGDAKGTNPEELVAAAHAACFNMRLASLLAAENFPEMLLETSCKIFLEDGSITRSNLCLRAACTGISAEDFQRMAEEARKTCPMSRLLNAEITLEAVLQSS